MKAIRLGEQPGLDTLALVDLPDPGAPGPGEIRVRIHASSLNFHDLGVVTGFLKTPAGRIPMSDGAGVVEAVGAGVTEFSPGDHVVSTFFPTWQAGEPMLGDFATTPGDGLDGYAQEVVVAPAQAFTRAPADYSHAEAAALTTAGLTAWRALIVNGGLKPGDTVLALGTGGVSIFALQIAKAMGATVIVTSSSDEKLERARALGADHLVNYRREPEWAKLVLELTGGRGVDHVIEVGGPGTLAQSIGAIRIGGHIALTGVTGAVPTAALMARQARLQGIVVGSRQHQIDMVRGVEGSLEHHVPAGHLVRAIDRFVDLAGVRAHLKPFYSETGRPSIDPELMIRMLLIGYCFGIRSERRLCEEVHLNLAYRWFCRLGLEGAVPDHSTFSKNRHGRFRDSDLLRELFETTVRRCIEEGLVGGEDFAVDASLIKADTNKQRSAAASEQVDWEGLAETRRRSRNISTRSTRPPGAQRAR